MAPPILKHLPISLFVLITLSILIVLIYCPDWNRSGNGIEQSKAAPPTNTNDAHHLVFCSDVWAPFAGVADSPTPGYCIEVIKAIYENEGYSANYITLPWTRCIEDTRSGRLTALLAAHKVDAPDFIFPTEQIARTSDLVFYVRADSDWNYDGLQSLKHIKLGYIQDYAYPSLIYDYIKANTGSDQILASHGDEPLLRLIEALQMKRIDAFIEFSVVGNHKLRQLELEHAIINGGAISYPEGLYVAFSPARPDAQQLADLFDLKVKELRKNGTLKAISQKYEIPYSSN